MPPAFIGRVNRARPDRVLVPDAHQPNQRDEVRVEWTGLHHLFSRAEVRGTGSRGRWRRAGGTRRAPPGLRRGFCHSADTPSLSLLKRLLQGERVRQNDSLADGFPGHRRLAAARGRRAAGGGGGGLSPRRLIDHSPR